MTTPVRTSGPPVRTSGPRIVIVGSTMIDLVAFADRLPDAGETVVGTGFLQGFGGKGANQAVAAARFGATVAMVGAVGDDPNGRSILTNLAEQRVGTDDVVVVAATSGVAPIWVDDAGMNRIIIVPGANEHVPPERAIAAVEWAKPAVVVGQFEIPQATTTAGFQAARRFGAMTVLNPAPGAAIDSELLAVTDWLVPNEVEFEQIGGRPLTGAARAVNAAIVELGNRLDVALAVTLGERGAAIRPRGRGVIRVPAPRVRAVDTTGAGDVFVAGFAVGLGLGWSPVDAARLGCAAGSDSVTRPGTQSSYPDREAASRLIADVKRAAAGAKRAAANAQRAAARSRRPS
jgi:ribokinase